MNADGFYGALVDWVVQVSWQVSWLVLLVGMVRWLGRSWMSPAWRHALWFPVVVRLILPVAPPSALSLYRITPFWDGMGRPTDLVGAPALVVAEPQSMGVELGRGGRPPTVPFAAPEAQPPVAAGAAMPILETGAGTSGGPALLDARERGPKPVSSPQAVAPVSPVQRGIHWRRWVGAVWLVGMVAAGGVMLAAYGRLAWRLSRRGEVSDPRVRRIWRECSAVMGVRREVRLFVASEAGSPALFGFWRCCLLLPPGLAERFSDAELRHVFLHELAHVRRGDVTLNALLAVLQVVHWFHPMVWWAFGRMRADRELATDALALTMAGEQEARGYGSTVIKVLDGAGTASMAPGLVGILEDRRDVADRIRMIARFRPRPRWSWLAPGVVAAVAVLGLTDPRTSSAGARAAAASPAKAGEATALKTPTVGLPPETKGRAVRVVVRDAATDQPVAGAEVFAPNEVAFSGLVGGGPRWVTDDAGQAEIRLGEVPEQPEKAKTWFTLSVRASGYAGHGLSWAREEGDVRGEIPEQLEVRLRHGSSLGGVVRDAGGRALPGIHLTAWGSGHRFLGRFQAHQTYPEYWRTLHDSPAAITDAEGRWKLVDVPLDLPNIVLECRRPDGAVQTFVHPREDQNPNLESGGTQVRLEELRRGEAVLVLAEGHTIRGRVVSPTGQPLAGARVVEAHGVVNLYRDSERRTDAEGRFVLPHRPPREVILTADAPGYALTSRVVPAEGDGVTSDVELRVAPLSPLTIRVRDDGGKPLAETELSLSTMRMEGQALDFTAKTDADGKAVWTNAPAAPVVLVATSPTLKVARKFRVEADQREAEVILRPGMDREVVVRGKVVDARTGAPLKVSAAWVQTKPWELEATASGPSAESAVLSADGFEVRVPSTHWQAGGMYPSYRVRIRVPHYGVWVGRERDFDEGDWEFTVQLERESEKAPLRILLADGRPAGGARVRVQQNESHWLFLMELQADQPVLVGPRGSPDFDFDADAEGRATLPGTVFEGGVVVTHPDGFASVKRSELRGRPEIRLQPWGRIEGICKEGDRTAAGKPVYLNSGDIGLTPWMANQRRITDADGRFVFPTVPPGDATVGLGFERGIGPITMHQQKPLVVEPGRTLNLQVGGEGRPVIGRALGAWNWERDVHVLVLKSGSPEPRMARIEDFATVAGFEKARDEWYVERHRHQREQRTHVLNFAAGGAFRVEDVPPGRYELRILVRKPMSDAEKAMMSEGQIVARCVREVEVPSGNSSDPLDLGDLELVPEPGVEIPATALQRSGSEKETGIALPLTGYQGRYVLLRLTADWVEDETDARAELEKFHQQHAKPTKWIALTWSLDDGAARGRGDGAGKDGKTDWVETRLIGRAKIEALDALRVDTLPMNVLLDPDGRELARDSRLEALTALLERRLVQANNP
ncbi:MAG: carboxypeptidase regulatory-like domain-containing protein [Verrucomicrobiales bacterium]|nr:carboxypeptidase regulatory-like domain-containing protein [Verrucomicrobiales bacterium]